MMDLKLRPYREEAHLKHRSSIPGHIFIQEIVTGFVSSVHTSKPYVPINGASLPQICSIGCALNLRRRVGRFKTRMPFTSY